MRKTLINTTTENTPLYLDLATLARMELSSECPAHPIESALLDNGGSGWRAKDPGAQTIRLIFDQPQTVQRLLLQFDERELSRTQEFVLRWRRDNDGLFREILRQQYHFSPPETTREVEDYSLGLSSVIAIELQIIPDISGGAACAQLTRLRLMA